MRIAIACLVSAVIAFGIGAAQATSSSKDATIASTQSDIKKLKRQVKSLSKIVNYTLTSKLRTTTERYVDVTTNGYGYAAATVRCPFGSVPTGGGGSFGFDMRQGDKLVDSRPYPGGWTAAGMSYASVAGRTFRVSVMCAER